MMSPENRLRGKRNRAVGDQCEWIAKRAMAMLGVILLERVHTPWRIQRAMRHGRNVIVGATPMEKVSGDFRGVLPGGRSFLAESKHREERLVHSDIEPHQRVALEAHAAAGGFSLVAWTVLEPVAVCYLLPWDLLLATGFRARTSLSPEQAEAMTLRPGHFSPPMANVPGDASGSAGSSDGCNAGRE